MIWYVESPAGRFGLGIDVGEDGSFGERGHYLVAHVNWNGQMDSVGFMDGLAD